MEHKFIKIIQKTKAQKEQKNPFFNSFEGALFKETSWFFHFQEHNIPLVPRTELPSEILTANQTPLTEILFVGDTFQGEGDDLLGKMINAMKLNNSEFYRFKMDEDLDTVNDLVKNLESPSLSTQKLLAIILEIRPRIVVSLGATVTNVLLGKREKMSTIHGQFFEKKINGCDYALMPIFHPDFLVINPNMKRTAWIDLQKVMERIGKI